MRNKLMTKQATRSSNEDHINSGLFCKVSYIDRNPFFIKAAKIRNFFSYLCGCFHSKKNTFNYLHNKQLETISFLQKA